MVLKFNNVYKMLIKCEQERKQEKFKTSFKQMNIAYK